MIHLEKLKNVIKQNIIEILYIISLCICFQTTFPYFGELNYFIRYFITFGWFCYFVYELIKKKKINKKDFQDFIVLIIPSLFIFVYSIFLLIIGKMEFAYVGRFISSIVSIAAPFIMLLIGQVLFKDKIFKISIYAFIFSFLALMIANFAYYGIGDTIYQWVNSVFIDNSTAKNHFEVHDMTFASAELLLFMILYFKRSIFTDKKKILLFISVLAVFLLGFKRIAIVAMVAMGALIVFNNVILKNKNTLFKEKYYAVILSLFIVFLFSYVWFIDSGTLTALCNALNINTMDRISFYEWLAGYFDFSPFFLGAGFGASSKMMHLYNSWGIAFNLGSIHSDVLKLFFELGFIGFLVLMIYYFFIVPRYIQKERNYDASIYIYLQILLFLFHLTDNTYSYYMTQYYYGVIFLFLCNMNRLIKLRGEKGETSIDSHTSL